MKNVIVGVVVIALVAVIVVDQQRVGKLRSEAETLRAQLAAANADAERAAQAPKTDGKESERIEQERAELVKLRGEVSALRKEKAEWAKSRGASQSATLAAAQPQSPPQLTQAAQGMQWVETILNGPPQVKGTEVGNVRRKLLSGEQPSEAEMALIVNMGNKAAEVEKSPEEFSNYQTSYIGSLLGWNNDPRTEAVKGVLNAAMSAAAQKGFDYHAPGQNADNWQEDQKALNTRATGAVQNLLKPEERAIFDRALIGVLGVDTGFGAPTPKQ